MKGLLSAAIILLAISTTAFSQDQCQKARSIALGYWEFEQAKWSDAYKSMSLQLQSEFENLAGAINKDDLWRELLQLSYLDKDYARVRTEKKLKENVSPYKEFLKFANFYAYDKETGEGASQVTYRADKKAFWVDRCMTRPIKAKEVSNGYQYQAIKVCARAVFAFTADEKVDIKIGKDGVWMFPATYVVEDEEGKKHTYEYPKENDGFDVRLSKKDYVEQKTKKLCDSKSKDNLSLNDGERSPGKDLYAFSTPASKGKAGGGVSQ